MSMSAAAKAAAYAQQTKEVFLLLVQVDHSALPDPIRVACNTQDVEHGGETFVGTYFKMTMPDESDEVPRAQVVLDNVDRKIVDAVRAVGSPPTVTMTVVLASSPDVVEFGPFPLLLVEATYDAGLVQGSLIYDDILNEPYPPEKFVPALYPGLF